MSRTPSRDVVRAYGVAVAALGALIVAGVLVTAVFESRTARDSQAAAASTPVKPKPDAAALLRFRTHWAGFVRISVSAFRAHDTAGSYLRSGNDVAASGELKKCQETAGGIVRESGNLPLDTGYGFDAELATAVKKIGEGLQNGCTSARSFLSTGAAYDYENAQTHFSAVVEGIFQSQQLARVKYQSLGGNPDSLLDFKTALR